MAAVAVVGGLMSSAIAKDGIAIRNRTALRTVETILVRASPSL
jgi:hypothetical protein